MIKAIGFLAGGLAVFGGLLVLLAPPRPEPPQQLGLPAASALLAPATPNQTVAASPAGNVMKEAVTPNVAGHALSEAAAPNTAGDAMDAAGAPNTALDAMGAAGAPNTALDAMGAAGAPNTALDATNAAAALSTTGDAINAAAAPTTASNATNEAANATAGGQAGASATFAPRAPDAAAARVATPRAASAEANVLDEAALVEAMFASRTRERAAVTAVAEAAEPPARATGGTGAPPAIADAGAAPVADSAATAAAGTDDARQWFAVWDPFHSELSAAAFARRLGNLTGLDYRVVRSAPANYEVAVAFADEQERVANLEAIEQATGLRIAGGSR